MSKNWNRDLPEHPAVNWHTLESVDGKATVEITCPVCNFKRRDPASQVLYRIKNGTFTGMCYQDRLLNKERSGRLPRLEHPAVNWNNTRIIVKHGQRLTAIAVTCPKCGKTRYTQAGPIAAKIREGGFTGLCLSCSPNARKREWTLLGAGRKLDPVKGYIRVFQSAVDEADMPLFRAMITNGGFVFEHRLVMAKALGRPLRSNELVDHMDGNKTNNDPSNLRLYIRGKNQPGETTGYGTYYDEWQRAEARIRQLEALIAARA